MKNRLLSFSILAALCAVSPFSRGAAPEDEAAKLRVQVDQPGHAISPMLYGIFFEEINRAGDGGIYAEMIQNRSFEASKQLEPAWSLVKNADADGAISLEKSNPLNENNPTSLRLEVKKGRVGVANHGYRHGVKGASDLAVEQGKEYELSLYTRGDMPMTATLEKPDGTVLAIAELAGAGKDWKKFEVSLTPNATVADARLVIAGKSVGTAWLDMVSLFPKGQLFRADLLAMLREMKPAFLRFPGGCFVEGGCMKDAARWKQSIGDIAQRPGHWNLWGYLSTDGLGYHEYLLLCEELKTEPLFVINAGMSHTDNVPMDKMGEFVQDALDAIEYANGPVDSKWGVLRAKAGHPESFHLKYLEIGNENGGALYAERYPLFVKAIKAKYPDVKIIANSWQGAYPKSAPAEIIGEHLYSYPEFLMLRADYYDTYDRKGPKVYVGEYATKEDGGHGNLIGALAEAAFMTGMERNSDIVVMASYAPLFERVGFANWFPNAIRYNASECFGTPSYQVQKLIGHHRADVVLPVELSPPQPEVPVRAGRIGVGTWHSQAEFKDICVKKDGKVLFESDFTKGLAGWKTAGGKWETKDGVLRQTNPDAEAARLLIGDPNWTDYTLSFKARKTANWGGVLALFQMQNDNERSWWHVGYFGNHCHYFETPGVAAPHLPGKMEMGQWHDIRVELKGNDIRGYFDGKLIQETHRRQAPSLYAVAGRKQDTGDIILKVVNTSAKPIETYINLSGAEPLQPTGKAWILTSTMPGDENSFKQPTKVGIKETALEEVSGQFRHAFPAYSVTVMQLREKAVSTAATDPDNQR